MRKIKFKIENVNSKTLSVYHNIQVKYDKDDLSLFSVNGGGSSCLCTSCAYISLSFDNETKRVSGVDGLLGNLTSLSEFNFAWTDKLKKGVLKIDSEQEFDSGVGYDFEFPNKIQYDSFNKVLSIGDYNLERPLIQILMNVYAQLNHKNELVALVVTNI